VTELAALLDRPQFPRSHRYDHARMLDDQMGPNALWPVEWRKNHMPFRRVVAAAALLCLAVAAPEARAQQDEKRRAKNRRVELVQQ